MSFGLEVYGPDGVPTLTVADRVGRVLGSVVSGTGPGSIVDPGLATGTPFFILRADSLLARSVPPTVVISGTQLSWSFVDSNFRTSAVIFYGVY